MPPATHQLGRLPAAIINALLTQLMPRAVEEATIALVRLYQNFTFQLSENCVEPLDLKQAITMAPKDGVPVYVTQRA